MAWKRSSGNSLNGAGAKIAGITFELEDIQGVKDKSKTYEKATAVVEFAVDGVEDNITRYYEAGFLPDGVKLNKDKKTFKGDAPIVSDGSAFDKFIGSAIEGGFPESDIEEGEGRDFSALEGKRVILRVEADRDTQIRIGKAALLKAGKKNPTDEEAMEAGKRKVAKGEHKGKMFNRELVLVNKVLGEEEAGGKSVSGGKSGKSAKETEPEETDELSDDRKDEVLKAILADAKDFMLSRKRIHGAIVAWAVDNNIEKVEREALKVALFDTDYLEAAAERGVVAYDSDNEVVTLAKAKGKKK